MAIQKQCIDQTDDLMSRVILILDQARANVVRAVNSNMVIAYWLVGREIVLEMQQGERRAGYRETLLRNLSEGLTARYGKGFSNSNLKYFRQFYRVYADRVPAIGHLSSGQFDTIGFGVSEIGHKPCGQLVVKSGLDTTTSGEGILGDLSFAADSQKSLGFSASVSWSHYRALLKVENRNERLFYEIETEKEGWDVSHLEKQIHSFLFARLLKSRDKDGVFRLASEGQVVSNPIDVIKQPYILDFLGLPELSCFQESDLESAIIEHLQPFLLELGKGFAFVARQHRVTTESHHFYIDLVFYNYLLKCFVLIDLKIGKLTHQDIGQMEMYTRMFDELRRSDSDNPTVGLILCAEHDEVVARYSVLNEYKQLFASRYMLFLPTEEELQRELARERGLIEARQRARKEDQE